MNEAAYRQFEARASKLEAVIDTLSADRVVKVVPGNSHTCVVAVDGTLRCWGTNSEGQLGYGTTEDIGDDATPGEYFAAHGCGAVPVFGGRGC
ncbi:Regulator of chromosome condensation (RCC1) repeat-containing protein [Nannocystis exedens]|uniref:Regulator of chromosome condensation (RCC1) repeat-containing protein n=1 Tax=Nannocystis exedens TaxID=54 RepID=A0A1I2HEN1_9BACT|nr:RCC1 domain-containing protein [Nannocystis exedens]PCC67877.1 hypothetical protein NAEX_00885 [Nannocystis exedens]SFF28122.1 Regulator of chromosome condensation (RCC1) repeat-containing protein [Nannocystis exedens]